MSFINTATVRSAIRNYGDLDSSNDPDFDDIVRRAAQMFGAPIALVSFLDADRQWFKAKIGLIPSHTPRTISFCTHTVRGDTLFKVEDTHKDERFCNNPLVTGDPGIRFYAGLPLRISNGRRLGTLCVIDKKPRYGFSDRDTDKLSQLANETQRLIERRQAGVPGSAG